MQRAGTSNAERRSSVESERTRPSARNWSTKPAASSPSVSGADGTRYRRDAEDAAADGAAADSAPLPSAAPRAAAAAASAACCLRASACTLRARAMGVRASISSSAIVSIASRLCAKQRGKEDKRPGTAAWERKQARREAMRLRRGAQARSEAV